MSNNSYGFGDTYSSGSSRQQNPSSERPNYTAQGASLGPPFHRKQAAADTTTDFSSGIYQSQRYAQQRFTTSAGEYNWYPNPLNQGGASQGHDMNSINAPEQEGGKEISGNNQYDTTSLGNLAYASSLDYASIGGNRQQQSGRGPTLTNSRAGAFNDGLNTGIQHQNQSTQSIEPRSSTMRSGVPQKPTGPTKSSSATAHYRGRPSTSVNLPTPPTYHPPQSNKLSKVPMNTAVPRTNAENPDNFRLSARNISQHEHASYGYSQHPSAVDSVSSGAQALRQQQ